jgi:hypothetical protein
MIASPMEFEGLNQWLGFILGAVLGLFMQGEGQAFFVLMFQTISQRERVNYDLNPFHHIDVLSIPVLVFAGWGWTGKRIVEPPYFPDSWICRTLVPLSGSVANLLLVGILGSVHMFVSSDIVEAAVRVNILIAVANLAIPVPPLALGRALCCPFMDPARPRFPIELSGTIILTGLIVFEKVMHWPLLQAWVLFLSTPVAQWVLSG